MRKLADFKYLSGQALSLALPIAGKMVDCLYANCPDADGASSQRHPTPGVYIFWHEYIASLLMQWQRVPMTLLIGQHRDAQWLSHLADAMGYGLVRGSTSRGGARAIRELKQAAETSALGMTPDGPRGPRRELAMGPIWLASRLEMPIYCVAVGIDRAKRLGTWDRHAIPLPFSRVRMLISSPVTIQTGLEKNELEAVRNSIQKLMDDLHSLADRWANREISLRGIRPKVAPGKLHEIPNRGVEPKSLKIHAA